ncbi:MAG: MoaD/ThiS family protein [Pseudomonadota bacterium]
MSRKRLTIRYFAAFRDNAGCAEEQMIIDVDNAGQLFERLKERLGTTEPIAHCKVAVNDELADWSTPLSDGDVVLLFPPVAGG